MSELHEGMKAPVFKGVDQNGNEVSLKEYKGSKVIIYFYPKDDTPTCTIQACNLRDNYGILLAKGFKVIGVSTDSVRKHKKFEQKFQLPFPLVSDEDLKIVQSYGVWGEKKFMGRTFTGTHRTTFLIDERGIIKRIIKKPHSKVHTEEVLAAWD